MASDVKKPSILGVIGGSGLYQMEQLELIGEHFPETSFGTPSDKITEGRLNDRPIFFLPRHGRGHRLLPSEVPYQANILAMKKLGVTHLLAVSAVGIMQENISPGDMVIPDQIIDMTKGIRKHTFYGQGVVGHSMFADPFCDSFRKLLIEASQNQGAKTHQRGTYICVEGPRFSSRAESDFFRKTMNPSIIGMTAMPEASLAREAGLSYGLLGLATDYDCWHESEEDVSVEAVLQVLKDNSSKAQQIVSLISRELSPDTAQPFMESCRQAIITQSDSIPAKTQAAIDELLNA